MEILYGPDGELLQQCSTCRKPKPLTAAYFYVNKTKASGFQTVCIVCKKVYNKGYHRKTRQKYKARTYATRDRVVAENRQKLWAHLRAHPCVDCGEPDIIVLDFDHLRDKVMNISAMVSRGIRWERIEAEIAKCEVVCANDHRRRTARDWGWKKAMLAAS